MKILGVVSMVICLGWGLSAARATETEVALAELLRQADRIGARHPFEAKIVGTIKDYLLTEQILDRVAGRSLGAIRIYIIDAAKLSVDTSLSTQSRELARSTIDNAEALPDSVILLDRPFVDELLTNAKNEMEALAEGTYRYFEDDKKGGVDAAVAFGFMIRNEAYGNWLRLWRLAAANASSRTERQELEEKRIEALYDVSRELSVRADLGFAGALAPIIYHEVGHLLDGSSGLFLEDLKAWLNGRAAVFSSPVKLRVEAEADRKAALLTSAFLDGVEALDRGQFVLPGITATLEELRDQVISSLYEDFRGLSARDLRVTLRHHICKPDSKDDKQGFDRTDSIEHAYINADPILTSTDFEELRQRVLALYGDRSHPHGFRRASAIYDVVKAHTTLPLYKAWLNARSDVVSEDERVLQAAIADDPSLMARQETSSTRGISVPPSLLEVPAKPYHDYLATLFRLEEGANCQAFKCFTGRMLMPLDGYAEIAESGDKFLYARITFRLFGADPEGRDKGSDPKGYAYGLVTFFRTLLTTVQIATGETVNTTTAPDYFDDMALFRREVIACGFSSRGYVAGRMMIAVTTVREGDWISLIMQPALSSTRPGFIFDSVQDKWFSIAKVAQSP